jgi:hypothetical protein
MSSSRPPKPPHTLSAIVSNELARHVVRVRLPTVAPTAFALGCVVGIKFESGRSCPAPPQIVTAGGAVDIRGIR